MSRRFHQLLAVLLALATTHAAVACACPAQPAGGSEVPDQSGACSQSSSQSSPQACEYGAGSGAEPVEGSSSPRPAPAHDPCGRCDVKPGIDQIASPAPDAVPASAHPFFAPALVPLVSLLPATPVTSLDRLRGAAEGVLRPPLLRDLFHSRTLLLI